MNFTSSFSSYVLEIYDTDDYTGPNPIKVKGLGIIKGPENSQYFVVTPDQNIVSDSVSSHYFAIRAHYNQDSIDHVTDSVTTVSIVILEDSNIDTDHIYNFNDLKFWKVGKISPRL
ncbi:hypothetical protein MNBD_GAMMA12-1461 [hydrothermal vent metagenome]|uniref:Uncharacterized protein n=1 Tax=hydrothermal vent metagenome TaxID=652676 RepID=A0A3B0YSY7_9ZZZZ